MSYTNAPKVAVLYQAIPPPIYDGISKPVKPGGYSDSSADIAYALLNSGIHVLTSSTTPQEQDDLSWCFPDTHEGIECALKQGANCLWANTIIFPSHPLFSNNCANDACYVGQDPNVTEFIDDKAATNDFLRSKGLLLPRAWLLDITSQTPSAEVVFPCVVKPIRGRGSSGVTLCRTRDEFKKTLESVDAPSVLVEEYLDGEEITVTIMPPGEYEAPVGKKSEYWALGGPVIRFNHINGIAPYNGVVAVTKNSRAVLTQDSNPEQQECIKSCEMAAAHLKTTSPIRIDCRQFGTQNPDRHFRLFDVNAKPNMTGPGRKGREEQSSLTAMAAQVIGWDYPSMLRNILRCAAPLASVAKK